MKAVRITRGVDVGRIPTGPRSFASVGPNLEATRIAKVPAPNSVQGDAFEEPQSSERLERALLGENEALRATLEQLESQRVVDVDAAKESVRAAMNEQVAEAVEHFTAAVDKLVQQGLALSADSEEQVAQLALAIARRVVSALKGTDEAVVLDTVRKALAFVREEETLVVRVHPDQLQLVERHQSNWLAAVRNARSVSIEADERIDPGGCVVHTERGDVDARIESQLGVLEEKLLQKSE